MSAATLALIDGHYYAYRFFFAMPPLTGPGGRPTGVTYAFAKLFASLRANADISHWALVFDHPSDTFRHQLDPQYKAHRDPMPDALRQQIEDVQELATASSVPLIKIAGVEADDVLASLARSAAAAGLMARICTRDKDIDQVITDAISVWDTFDNRLKGPKELMADLGLTPVQVIDYLSMMGDSADNVAGIKGVGPKTALKLLGEYGTLDEVMANVAKLKGKLKENVEAFVPNRELTRSLITLVDVAGLPALDTLLISRDAAGDEAVYEKFGLKRARFFPEQAKAQAPASRCRIVDLAGFEQWLALVRAQPAPCLAVTAETSDPDPQQGALVGMAFAAGAVSGADASERDAVYLPFQGIEHALVDWTSAAPVIIRLLADPALGKVAHDAKLLARQLAHHGVAIRGLVGDTMLASWLLDPSRESHSLDFLSRMFLGEERSPGPDPLLPRAEPVLVQTSVRPLAAASGDDAQCIWRLHQAFAPGIRDAQLQTPYQEQELPIALCLALIENEGVGIDAAALATIQRQLEIYLEQVMASIRRIAGASFNPASPKQIAELLFEKLKLPVLQKTKSGPSTEAWVLEALRHQHELPDLLLQYRSLSKLLSTYLSRLPEWINPHTQRIHSHFRQTGSETGRLSSDQPNLQNIPKKSDLGREIRGAFVARPGHVFIAADYSQIELRILAHLCHDPTLAAAFAGDTDIHRFVAAKVHGIDEAAVTPAQRNAAKAVNFGIIYGQSAFGLAQSIGISRGEAQRFIDDYFARFSEVQAYITSTIAIAALRGYAETMAGRRRYIPQLASTNRNERLQGERIALNSTIQGSAADLIKRAMLRCDQLLPSGARLVLQIHDELLVEAREDLVAAASAALHTAMTGAWTLSVPLVTQVRSGRTWLEVS